MSFEANVSTAPWGMPEFLATEFNAGLFLPLSTGASLTASIVSDFVSIAAETFAVIESPSASQ